MLAAMKGKMPDQATLQQVPYLVNDKTDAGTLVRDGNCCTKWANWKKPRPN